MLLEPGIRGDEPGEDPDLWPVTLTEHGGVHV
jgi:hypothetical protein